MTTTRRHPGVSPRRHRGVVVVHLFNADRLTDSGLKPEIGPACHTLPDRQPRGLAHSAGQGSTAQPGGRRPYPSRSLAGDCFTYAGLERDSSHVPRCDGAFAGACPHSLRWHESELERRNRDLLAAGFPVMRFTGSEIFKDPLACAEQVREVASETLFRVSKAAACSDG